MDTYKTAPATLLFNDDWTFVLGDVPNGQLAATDDSQWRVLTLPHDWGVEGPFSPQWASGTGYLPGGIGWYRKHFQLLGPIGENRVFLHFDGVYCNSDVWVNGHHVGSRANGFASFRYDVTPYVASGTTNIVAVRVDHSQFDDSRWYTGSGINRNVYLVVTAPVHFALWAICATTPEISPDSALLQVVATVQNHGTETAEATVAHELLDSAGNVVSTAATNSHALPGQGSTAAIESTLTVPCPTLWSVDQPYLYTLRSTVRHHDQIVDAQKTQIGIRSIAFDPDHGFTLNSVPTKLKGVCVHDDAGCLGTAVPEPVWERRLKLLKAAGANALRMSHNVHMPELYDLCDKMGFLVQDEAFDEWEQSKNKWVEGWNVGQPAHHGTFDHFAECGEADLRDMVLRDRNHPSVVMWSIGNEVDYPNDPYTHEILTQGASPQIYKSGVLADHPSGNRLGEIARRLVRVVKQHDATRPVTAALASVLMSNETGYADALDLAGYNYQEFRYADDHAKYPQRVIYGSENGMSHENWLAVAEHDYVCGQFLWTGIDYLGEARQWPVRHSTSGLLDLAGLEKPEYYYRQSLWSSRPMVYIGTQPVPKADEGSKNLWRRHQADPVWAGTHGEMIRVNCFTNCEQAELFVNGRSVGVKTMADADEHIISWDIPYEPGVLSVNALHGLAVAATSQLRTAGPAAKLAVGIDRQTVIANGIDLVHVTVMATDDQGTPVYGATNETTWQIAGPARLLGLESGDPESHEDYRSNTRRLFHGRQLAYVQTTGEPGTITIRVQSAGLEETAITATSNRCEPRKNA